MCCARSVLVVVGGWCCKITADEWVSDLKSNILISKCPFNFDEFLVQYKIILEYLLHHCGTSSEVSSEYTVAEETCLGTRWQTPSQGTWRLTTARWTGRRGRSTAVIGVMTRKITIVITNLEFNRETEQRRLHVKTLFENIAFLSLQGLVKKEPKQNMSSSSEVNRGNRTA